MPTGPGLGAGPYGRIENRLVLASRGIVVMLPWRMPNFHG